MSGYVVSGTNSTTAFTLPAGYRPATDIVLGIANGTLASSYLKVTSAGAVQPALGGGTGSMLDCSFIADA